MTKRAVAAKNFLSECSAPSYRRINLYPANNAVTVSKMILWLGLSIFLQRDLFLNLIQQIGEPRYDIINFLSSLLGSV